MSGEKPLPEGLVEGLRRTLAEGLPEGLREGLFFNSRETRTRTRTRTQPEPEPRTPSKTLLLGLRNQWLECGNQVSMHRHSADARETDDACQEGSDTHG